MLGMIDWRPAQELSASVIQTKAGALGRLEEAPDTPITFSPGTCSVDTVDILDSIDFYVATSMQADTKCCLYRSGLWRGLLNAK